MVVEQLDASVSLFTSLIQHGASTPRYQRNLQGLLQLRALAASRISSALDNNMQQQSVSQTCQEGRSAHGVGGNEDVELIGWRTRLVERAGHDRRTIRTISVTTSPISASDTTHCQTSFRNQAKDIQSPLIFSDTAYSTADLDPTLTGNVVIAPTFPELRPFKTDWFTQAPRFLEYAAPRRFTRGHLGRSKCKSCCLLHPFG